MGTTKKRVSNGMGSIRKKQNGSYEVRYTEGFDAITGKQIQRSKSFKTEKEANAFRIKTLNQINEGTYIYPNQMPFSDLADLYLRLYTANLKPLTKSSYEDRLRLHIIPAIGEVKLCKLTPIMVQEFIDSLSNETAKRKALAPKTIKCIHGVLHKILNKAVSLGYIPKNPADDCSLPTVVAPDIEPFSEDKTIDFLKAIQKDKYEKVYFMGMFTGMRQSELLGLTWDCIDWNNNIITVKQQLIRNKKSQYDKSKANSERYRMIRVKNNKTRYICVENEIMNILRSRYQEQMIDKERACDLWKEPFPNLVFENEFGKNLAHATVRKHFKKIVAEIGLPEERFHNMRHNYTVIAIESGDDVNTVQQNLGHATSNFTLKVYDHVTAKRKTESAKRMDNHIKNLKEQMG